MDKIIKVTNNTELKFYFFILEHLEHTHEHFSLPVLQQASLVEGLSQPEKDYLNQLKFKLSD